MTVGLPKVPAALALPAVIPHTASANSASAPATLLEIDKRCLLPADESLPCQWHPSRRPAGQRSRTTQVPGTRRFSSALVPARKLPRHQVGDQVVAVGA